jgi:hypothetical protein
MKTSLVMSYASTGDGGVTIKVGLVGSDTHIAAMNLDRQGAVDAAARILAYSGVTEAEFSNNQLRVR